MITIKYADLWKRNAEKRILDVASRKSAGIGILKCSEYPNGKRVEDVAFAMEFGDGKVLPRPFVRNAIAKDSQTWKEKAKEELAGALKGEKSQTEAVKAVGDKVREDVVKSIDELVQPPLKETTVKRKRRKGRNNPEKPLVDSGLLRDSIVVEVKGR